MADDNKKVKLPMYVVPEDWAVLYVHPMNGKFEKQGRKCWNCFMWASKEEKCTIHPHDLKIPGNAVCGYHVPGVPFNKVEDLPNHKNVQHVDPKVSGLEYNIPDVGTMCGNCKYYKPSNKRELSGHCKAVTSDNNAEPMMKLQVKYYGCCTRWEQ